jgi:hypothetical protein
MGAEMPSLSILDAAVNQIHLDRVAAERPLSAETNAGGSTRDHVLAASFSSTPPPSLLRIPLFLPLTL